MPRRFRILHPSTLGLPWWLRGKEPVRNAGDAAGAAGSISGSGKSPEEGDFQPPTAFLPGKSHGQPMGSKESWTGHIYANCNMQTGRVTC